MVLVVAEKVREPERVHIECRNGFVGLGFAQLVSGSTQTGEWTRVFVGPAQANASFQVKQAGSIPRDRLLHVAAVLEQVRRGSPETGHRSLEAGDNLLGVCSDCLETCSSAQARADRDRIPHERDGEVCVDSRHDHWGVAVAHVATFDARERQRISRSASLSLGRGCSPSQHPLLYSCCNGRLQTSACDDTSSYAFLLSCSVRSVRSPSSPSSRFQCFRTSCRYCTRLPHQAVVDVWHDKQVTSTCCRNNTCGSASRCARSSWHLLSMSVLQQIELGQIGLEPADKTRAQVRYIVHQRRWLAEQRGRILGPSLGLDDLDGKVSDLNTAVADH